MCKPPTTPKRPSSSRKKVGDDTSAAAAADNAMILPFCSLRRAVLTFVFYWFPCIFLDVVASNYAVIRWNLLPPEQKHALPDITHDNFSFYEQHHLLKEWPLIILHCIVLFGFMVPYDCMGLPLSHQKLGKLFTTGLHTGSSIVPYRRGECWIRYFETRCVLELMRATTVWVTTTSDPHGLYCTEIEEHQIENVFLTWTLGRCGDNIYSGHASLLLSLAICVQCYVLALPSVCGGAVGSARYWVLTCIFWSTIVYMSFYIVVSRLHYTVDVVLAWFLVPTVWLAWSAVSGPSVFAHENALKEKGV